MMTPRLAIALLAALPALGASAQEAAPLLPQDPRAPRFHEVEHGLSASLEAGWMGLFKTPTAEPARYPSAGTGGGFSSGLHVGMAFGAELGGRLGVSLLLLGVNQTASVSYGSFSLVGAGADVRLDLARRADSQGAERLHLYAHARGAFVATEPHGLFGQTDVLVAAGPGVEYYTRLRHFSVGLALDGVFAVKAKAPGIAAVPTLRYTF
jgi:hypothetical protein